MESSFLYEMLSKEFNSSICKEKVLGFPLWRIYRSPMRFEYLNRKDHFIQATAKVGNLKLLIKNICISFRQLLILLLAPPKSDYCCFSFPRLYNIGGKLIDKITDPLLNLSSLEDNIVVFNQLFDNYEHKSYMLNKNHYMLDASWAKSMLMSYFIFPFVYVRYYRSVDRVYQIAKTIFEEYTFSKSKLFLLLAEFLSNMVSARIILGRIKPKCILVVNKENYLPYSIVAKKMGIKVLEIQHGATHGDTPLYSGIYDISVDPDVFCAFGKAWVGNQFGVPLERVKNIGWCYSTYVKNLYSNKISVMNHHVLVVSSPEISRQILEATIVLATSFPNYSFGLRLHPHQEMTKEERKLIKPYNNIYLQDKTIESNIAILSYNYVIGENSSVVYEALSLGKRVGRICLCDLNPSRVPGIENDGFYYIKNLLDFENFLNFSNNDNNINNLYYSKFNRKLFTELLNN